MDSFLTLMLLLFIHYVGDFILQTPEEATKKSEGNSIFNKYLFSHVIIYSSFWLVQLIALTFDFTLAFKFFLITFVAHYITDWLTSRWSKHYFSMKTPQGNLNGFRVVGFDQLLHYAQLALTFGILYKL